MRVLICAAVLIFAGAVAGYAQCTTQPGYICISQAAGNQGAENKRELDATRQEIAILKGAVADLKQQLASTQKTADQNVNDLKAENTKLLVQVADKSGALGECRADKVMYQALIEYLTKNQRARKIGLINL